MRNSLSRRGGIISGLLMTFAVIVILAMAAGIYIARNVRVETAHRRGGDDVSIDTPGGNFTVRAHENLDPAAVGIPIYPGATRHKDGGGAVLQWTSNDGKEDKGFSVVGAELTTPDPAYKVIDYYRKQLPNLMVVTDHDGATRLEYKEGGYKRIIVIREKYDGTHIGVASVGEPASN